MVLKVEVGIPEIVSSNRHLMQPQPENFCPVVEMRVVVGMRVVVEMRVMYLWLVMWLKVQQCCISHKFCLAGCLTLSELVCISKNG